MADALIPAVGTAELWQLETLGPHQDPQKSMAWACLLRVARFQPFQIPKRLMKVDRSWRLLELGGQKQFLLVILLISSYHWGSGFSGLFATPDTVQSRLLGGL